MPASLEPPYTLKPQHVSAVAEIAGRIGRAEALKIGFADPYLKRQNRIHSIQASLGIDGNSLGVDEVDSVVDRKRVAAPPREILAVRNASAAYKIFDSLDPRSPHDLLTIYRIMMDGLVPNPGRFRSQNIKIDRGTKSTSLNRPANRVEPEVYSLLNWLSTTDLPPILSGAVVHYKLGFIHPFTDGNGRIGRLWQALIQARWKPNLAFLPFECVIRDRKKEYIAAQAASDKASDAAPFVEFVLDAILESLSDKHTPERLNSQIKLLLSIFDEETDSIFGSSLMETLDIRHLSTFEMYYLRPALDGGYIEREAPGVHPRPIEKYRLTTKGKMAVQP